MANGINTVDVILAAQLAGGGGGGGNVTKAYVDQQDALKVDKSSVGVASGVAKLDANGKVPSSQLPSYVDDVIEGYYNTTDGKFYEESTYETEIAGTEGKIYVSLDTDKCYRWSGSEFVEISESLALGETSSTAYAGNKGKANADAITAIKNGVSIDSFGDVETALGNKVDKVTGKDLSTNDYSDAEKAKLDGIETGAEVNVQPDWEQSDDTADDYIKHKPDVTALQPKTMSSSVTIGADIETTVEGAIDELAGIVPSTAGVSNKLSTAADTAGEEIAGAATGTSIALTDSADGYLQGVTVKGHSEVVSGAIKSVGDSGFTITATNGDNTASTAATITTGLPLRSTFDGTVYDELTNDSIITRCEVVSDEVVAKATPVIIPLTSAEKSALNALRTYDTTHIDATDEPTMTVDYLLNTDNGQAVAKVDANTFRVKTFTYIGSGSTTNTITFPEMPKMVLGITGRAGAYPEDYDNCMLPFVWGTPVLGVYWCRETSTSNADYSNPIHAAYSGNSITFTNTNEARALNKSGVVYTVNYV